MNKYFWFRVTTVLNDNQRTTNRGIFAPDEHIARKALTEYYLTQRKAQVKGLKLLAIASPHGPPVLKVPQDQLNLPDENVPVGGE